MILGVVGVVMVFHAEFGVAQSGVPAGIKLSPKAGEQVEAYFLGGWVPAVVLDTNRSEVLVELEFAGGTQQRKLKISETRYPWQANVISPVYVWKDQSGSFSIKAAVVDTDADARTVTLYRLDEGTEITVPVDKLSEADQRRLGRIVKAAPLKILPPPPVESFITTRLDLPVGWQTATDLSNVPPDPPKIALAVPSGGAAFPKLDFWDNLLSLYPIGSSAGWMAAAAGADSSIGKGDFPGRLVWATLADGKVRKIQSIANGELLIAVDAGSQRVLTIGESDGKTTLTLLNASPKTDKAKPVVRWVSDKGRQGWTPFAEFVGGDRVLHRWGDSRYVVWDVKRRMGVYEVKQESFFDAPPVISPGKKYLALPEDKGVRIISANDGATLATLPVEGGSTSGVAFDARGEKLAVLTRNQLAIWNLGSLSDPQRVPASSVGSPFGQKLAWVDDRSLLVDGKTLFDLDRQLPIWSYSAAFAEVVDGKGFREVTRVAPGRLCYGVELRDRDQSMFIVGAVELPGDGVRNTIARVNKEKLWTLLPGTPVSIDTDCGTYNTQSRAALENAARSAGWVVQPSAKVVITAKMGRSEPKSVTYEMMGGGGSQTVRVAPYYSNVAIKEGSTHLWSTGSSSGASSFMWVKKDESIQNRIREAERPDPEFFTRVKFPGKILHPRFRKGFGTSTYGRLGLSAKPMADLPLLP